MDCVVTPLKTLMGFSVHLNVQLKFYILPFFKSPQQPAKAGVEDFFQLFIALAWLVDAVFGKPWWLDHK